MKELRNLFYYLLGTVLLGALLAPALFWGAHLAAAHDSHGKFAAFIAKTDFQRFFDRSMLIAALLLLAPLLKSIRLPNKEALGLAPEATPWGRFFAGLIISFLSMVVLGGLALWIGPYNLRSNLHLEKIAWLPVSAIGVAIVEEYLFRGAILGLAQRTFTPGMANVFVSLLFAIIHFLKPPETGIALADVYWYSGLVLLEKTFWQFTQPALLLGGVSTLFVVAMILGMARFRTRSLWMPIGLHAGWVFSKMSFSVITRRSGEAWPWFGPDILIGLGPVLVLLATGVVVWGWLNHADRKRGW